MAAEAVQAQALPGKDSVSGTIRAVRLSIF
jgi:hypothetical protein